MRRKYQKTPIKAWRKHQIDELKKEVEEAKCLRLNMSKLSAYNQELIAKQGEVLGKLLQLNITRNPRYNNNHIELCCNTRISEEVLRSGGYHFLDMLGDQLVHEFKRKIQELSIKARFPNPINPNDGQFKP